MVPAGSQLGLMIYSTDAEFTLRPAPGTELTVDLHGTTLELPVVGGPLAMAICAEPDPRETVVIGGVDSRVPNHTVAGNCTINQHVLDEEGWTNHGQFVVHVEELADLLVDAQLITALERAQLVSAAARSGVGS